MAGQDVSARGLICFFDGGTTPEFAIDRAVAFWAPEKYAVVVVLKRDTGWQSCGAIWHDHDPFPGDVLYESSDVLRYELFELESEGRDGNGARVAHYKFKERL